MKRLLTLILSILLIRTGLAQKEYQPTWESLDSRPVPSWFKEAKLGIFIHWGPYSVPAWSPKGTYSEWYQYWLQTKGLFGNGCFSGTEVYDYHTQTYGKDFSYYNFGEMFTANNFDADEWADLIKKSGAKYMIITSKHHDGFCLWPNETANKSWGRKWNSQEIGPKRDLLKELEIAIRKTDIKFGTYYSLYEWFNPLWKENPEQYALEHMHPQFKELVENYKPDIVWADGEWEMESAKWHTPELIAWLYNDSPVKDYVVINDRWGKKTRSKHGGYFTAEYQSELDGEYPWEEGRGIGFSFGYNKNEDAWDYTDSRTLVYLLLNVVSNGGNLLLDIGPDAEGNVPPIMQERLIELGKWLKINGEAIYGTEKWQRSCQWSQDGKTHWMPEGKHYLPADYILKQTIDPQPGYAVREIFFTCKEKDVFAIVPKFPKGELVIRDFQASPHTKVTMLGSEKALSYKQRGKDLVITVPFMTVDELPCQYAWVFRISE